MLDNVSRETDDEGQDAWPINDLWNKYEKIAMHFNDLLIRLRIQALGVVAALSTLVGIFAKTDPASIQGTWEIATGLFLGLCMFWVAIWILDLKYYNKLLIGAVSALLVLEKSSKSRNRIRSIEMSTMIEKAVAGSLPQAEHSLRERFNLRVGIWSFYIIVFTALLIGFCISFHKCTGYIPAVLSRLLALWN